MDVFFVLDIFFYRFVCRFLVSLIDEFLKSSVYYYKLVFYYYFFYIERKLFFFICKCLYYCQFMRIFLQVEGYKKIKENFLNEDLGEMCLYVKFFWLVFCIMWYIGKNKVKEIGLVIQDFFNQREIGYCVIFFLFYLSVYSVCCKML